MAEQIGTPEVQEQQVKRRMSYDFPGSWFTPAKTNSQTGEELPEVQEQQVKRRMSYDFPGSCFTPAKTNSQTGEEFGNIRMPEGFEIAGTDLDGNDLTGRDLGAEGYYISQTYKKDDMSFVHKSKYFEGGRRITHNPDYPVTLKQRVQDPQTEEWSDGPQIKVDAETFDKALKSWQYAKGEDGRNLHVETMQIPRDMVQRVETKDGDVFYNVACPDTTIDRKDVSGMQFTFGNARELPWDTDKSLYGFDAFKNAFPSEKWYKGESIAARNPQDRSEVAWVNPHHANMAYKDDRIRVEKATSKDALTAKSTAAQPTQQRDIEPPTAAMDAPRPVMPTR